jgi:4-hydroxy-tetrahydrodipicolinate reductase
MSANRGQPKGVLIYGTGEVGQAVARLVLARGWPIAGAVNRAGAKVGRDLGELAGLEPSGVIVEDAATANLRGCGADIAVLAVNDNLASNLPIHRRLLEAGLNVVCIGAESSYPEAVDAGMAGEIDSVAKANDVTLTGCGFWDTYRLWSMRVLAGPCTALRGLRHYGLTNANRYGAALAGALGIGGDPAGDPAARAGGGGDSIYRVLMYQAVASLGLTVTGVRQRQEAVTSDQPLECVALGRVIAPGEVTGMRSVIEVDTREGVPAVAEIELRLTEPGEEESMGWIIDGDPPVEMRLSGIDTGHATVSSAVCRIPDVIAASPGLVTTDGMGPIRMPTPSTEMGEGEAG